MNSSRVKKYLDGDWKEAREILTIVDRCVGKRIRKLCHNPETMPLERVNEGVLGDGPSRTLLNFMAAREFVPPRDWDATKGRALTSK